MNSIEVDKLQLEASQVEDLKLAASKMTGEHRRSFHAAMAVKYCGGSARQAEAVFGWNRQTVESRLHERWRGIICLTAHEACGGSFLWEERPPDVANALWELAQSHSQQDPSFCTILSYTRLTSAEAPKQLRGRGFEEEVLPSPSTIADVLNRNGYRLRPMVKAKPQKSPGNRCHLRQPS